METITAEQINGDKNGLRVDDFVYARYGDAEDNCHLGLYIAKYVK